MLQWSTDPWKEDLGKSKSVIHMLGAYLFSFALGWAGMTYLPTGTLLWDLLVFDLFATLGIFLCSLLYNNSSLYDPYWSVLPMWLVAIAWYQGPGLGLSEGLLFAVVMFWGIRLTWNFLRGWPGMAHEDWRYVNFRRTTGRLYWLVSFSGIHFFPTALVFAGMSSVILAFDASETAASPIMWVGAMVAFVAVVIELVADNQLRAFVKKHAGTGSIMKEGLWKYSRHPNYFGELMFWWGCCICAWGAAELPMWVWIGPLSMTALFYLASIPMLDKRSVERRPAYAEHMKTTSSLIPWFPKSN